jgi:hypothetical protein
MMKINYYQSLALLLICLLPLAGRSQWVTHHEPLFMTDLPQPDAGVPYTDPKTGIQVTRVTDAVESGFAGAFPDYSKRQAWNADQSGMILRTDNGDVLLFDGETLQFTGILDGVTGQDIFWHPANPDIIYFNPDSILYSRHIPTGDIDLICSFAPFNFASTCGEGNLSDDGRYYAVVGQYYDYSSGEVTFSEILFYDLQEEVLISSLTIPQDSIWGFDWVSVSRGGNYIVIDYADTETGRYHGVEVYDRMMNFVWQKPLGAGHSDLGTEPNGDEILVMDIYDEETNETVFMKYRLADGQETELLRTSLLFDQHISLRNEARKEWCFVSTFDYVGRLTDDSSSWLPFEDEVFTLKLDGSGDVQRIAHHHSRRFSPSTPDPDNSVYWAEPHATVDRSGKRVLWGSNWRLNMQNVSSVDAYVADFSNLDGIEEDHTVKPEVMIFPNPVTDFISINLVNIQGQEVTVSIVDLTGRQLFHQVFPAQADISFLKQVSVANFTSGAYVIHVNSRNLSCSALGIKR